MRDCVALGVAVALAVTVCDAVDEAVALAVDVCEAVDVDDEDSVCDGVTVAEAVVVWVREGVNDCEGVILSLGDAVGVPVAPCEEV